ncbi:hypothetical protein [Streptomyces sp. NPDC046862]|uniref:hypothetical protein n=1 Tax=Streptomyces sp. NPDC046862 TaxID=3154603 RepID=UPI003453788A
MMGPASLRRVISPHPRLLDAALATLLGTGGVLYMLLRRVPGGGSLRGVDAVAAGAAFLLVLVRHRAPLPVLALSVLGEIAITAVTSSASPVLGAAALISVYTVARTVRRRVALIAAAITAVALYFVVAHPMDPTSRTEGAGVLAWVGMCAAVGAPYASGATTWPRWGSGHDGRRRARKKRLAAGSPRSGCA